jgi:carbamoyltransferase
MKLLGLHVTGSQASAALLLDGEVMCAAAEERFNRVKHSRDFPMNAIRFCLDQAGLSSIEELDGIAVSWNPAQNMRNINLSGFTSWRRYDPEWLYIVPNQLMTIAGKDRFDGHALKMELSENSRCPLYFVDHHMAHLAHATLQSPFEKGMVAIVDEYGEFDSVTIGTFNEESFRLVKRIPYPNSLGVFYAAVTEFLGFMPNLDEWKVMGAAAYGDPQRFRRKLEHLLRWDRRRAEWILDTRFIEHSNMKRAGYLSERLVDFIGIPLRRKNDALDQNHFDVAASAQLVFEQRLFQLLIAFQKRTGEDQLAGAGGVFMNSLANGKILSATPFRRLFIPYAAADNGGAMGAALFVWHYILGNKKRGKKVPTPYLGPSYTDDEIEQILTKYRLPYRKVDKVALFAAQSIADGSLVGWFQGRMEFGERALGNRSILADPRNAEMKDKINAAVKYRESFRPFAPSIMEERAPEYFTLPEACQVPYMEQVYPVRSEKAGLIPAVVHADGTGRLQMVSRESNGLFYELLSEFERFTGIPLVLNTSFNLQGEPIVCSPKDAIRTFMTSGLDMLVIGSFIITK